MQLQIQYIQLSRAEWLSHKNINNKNEYILIHSSLKIGKSGAFPGPEAPKAGCMLLGVPGRQPSASPPPSTMVHASIFTLQSTRYGYINKVCPKGPTPPLLPPPPTPNPLTPPPAGLPMKTHLILIEWWD